MKKKSFGFTLVELIITIAITTLISSISIYSVNKIINNSKEKNIAHAINNIKKTANTYIIEYPNEILWKEIEKTTNEESCISTTSLISKGYLKENIQEFDNIPKSIIITRNKDKTIISEKQIPNDCESYYNTVAIPTSNDICNDITYNKTNQILINQSIKMDNYKSINYQNNSYNNTSNISDHPINAGNYKVAIKLANGKQWEDNTIKEKIVTCKIKKAIPILNLDSTGNDSKIGTTSTSLTSNISGKITLKSSNKKYATASITDNYYNIITEKNGKSIQIKTLASRTTPTYITITITPDDTYKNNYTSATTKYTINSVTPKPITKPNNSICNNLTYNGNTQTLAISTNEGYKLYNNTESFYGTHTVTAKLNYGYIWEDDNSTKNVEFNCEIKRPTPTVTYKNATCNPQNKTVLYNDKYNDLCIPEAKPNYTFIGWYIDTDYTTKITKDSIVTNYKNHNLYAKWKPNQIHVRYNMNGGTWAGSTETSLNANNDGYITKNGIIYEDLFEYSSTNNNLSNWNNSDWINIINPGHIAANEKEWNTKSDGSGTSYNQSTDISHNELCDASNSDCTITLYVNWISGLTVTFDPNYKGTSSKTETFVLGTQNQKFTTTFSRSGYTLVGWAENSTDTTPKYSLNHSVSEAWIKDNSPSITLYAIWMRKAQHSVSNGKWNIFKTYGYVTANGNADFYQYLDTCKYIYSSSNATEYDKTQSNYHIGTTNAYVIVYTNTPIVSQTTYCSNKGYYKEFYKIYIKEDDIHQNKYGYSLTDITDKLTINSKTYYAVWVAASCTYEGCPSDRKSLKYIN